jgi:hypothetical protein
MLVEFVQAGEFLFHSRRDGFVQLGGGGGKRRAQ